MKRSITLVAACALGLGCGAQDKDTPQEPTPKPVEVAEPADEEAGDEAPREQTTPEREPTIVEVAMNDERFTTLVSALERAELVETLRGEGPFTVFAPTNEAFGKLPEGTLDAVMADEAQLTAILKHHVVAQKVTSRDLAGLSGITMLDGTTLPLDVSEGVAIGQARVEQADIITANGVIHVIDTVLLPE